jgi:hypothetical protein
MKASSCGVEAWIMSMAARFTAAESLYTAEAVIGGTLACPLHVK